MVAGEVELMLQKEKVELANIESDILDSMWGFIIFYARLSF